MPLIEFHRSVTDKAPIRNTFHAKGVKGGKRRIGYCAGMVYLEYSPFIVKYYFKCTVKVSCMETGKYRIRREYVRDIVIVIYNGDI